MESRGQISQTRLEGAISVLKKFFRRVRRIRPVYSRIMITIRTYRYHNVVIIMIATMTAALFCEQRCFILQLAVDKGWINTPIKRIFKLNYFRIRQLTNVLAWGIM